MFGYSKFKAWVVIVVSVFGLVFSLPNFLPDSVYKQVPESVRKVWHPVTLGLDLSGGSYLLLQVETDALYKEQLTSLADSVRTVLVDRKVRFSGLKVEGEGDKMAVSFKLLNGGDYSRVRDIISRLESGLQISSSGAQVSVSYSQAAFIQMVNSAVEQSIQIVRRRIDELGTKEPSIQKEGTDRIRVQLPGVQEPGEVKALLGKTAKMTFHLVDEGTSVYDAQRGKISPDSMLVPGDDMSEAFYVLKRAAVVGGDQFQTASSGFQNGTTAVVNFQFKQAGARKFSVATRDNVGKRLAIVLDGRVISAPVIQSHIPGGSGTITGNFTIDSAENLALMLRSGALPAPLSVVEEKVIGPGLGTDSIEAGFLSCMIGVVLVFAFVFLIYGKIGTFANIALIFNGLLLLAILGLFNATLTLPGVAGIALTIGMAVDSNILVFERMREELTMGRTAPLNVINAGFENSFTGILDSQLTTLFAALVLYWLGSGPVKGFGVTLGIGILTTMFTAIMVTKFLMLAWLQIKKPKEIVL